MLLAVVVLVAVAAWAMSGCTGATQAATQQASSNVAITSAGDGSVGLKVVKVWASDPLRARVGGKLQRTAATIVVRRVVGGAKNFRGEGRRVEDKGVRIVIAADVPVKRRNGKVDLDDLKVSDLVTVTGRFVTPASRAARTIPTFRASKVNARTPSGTVPGSPRTPTTPTTPSTTPPATPPGGSTQTPSAPAPGGFPSAATTGVPAGTALRSSGGVTVNTPGAVIDGLDIRGDVTVNANDVTIKRSRIQFDGYNGINVKEGVTGVRIEDVALIGCSCGTTQYGIRGPATVLRADISRVDNGAIPYSGSLIQDSYVHDLAASGSDPHFDGIEIDGGSNITLRHNTIVNDWDQTSAVMIANTFGSISDITVENNRIVGGGYTLYVDGHFNSNPMTGVKILNNRFGKGYWGYAVIRDASGPVTRSGNVDDTTGRALGL